MDSELAVALSPDQSEVRDTAQPQPAKVDPGVRRRRRRTAILFAVWLVLAGASAAVLGKVQSQSRAEIESRFQLRADLASRFVETYVSDFLAQEERAASRELSGPRPSPRAFGRVVSLLGAEAAVLLDDQGVALRTAPTDPAIQGTNLSQKYAHLESAVDGTPAVSNVVPSAVEGIPIVAFAVPYQASSGRRVFSGAFDIRSTPLADYLVTAAALAPTRAYLIDEAGALLSTNDPSRLPDSQIPDEIAPYAEDITGAGAAAHAASGDYVVSQTITGTPWRFVMTAPESYLYAAIGGLERAVPWLFWFGFAAGGLLSVWLLTRLLERRRVLAELNQQLDLLANVDVLTEIPNRRSTERELDRAVARSRRYGDPLSVLLIDIDSFKQINDGCGHGAGDAVLRGVAFELSAMLREVDIPGRWGGDEFVVVLPHQDADGAAIVAGRLNERIRNAPFVDDGKLIAVSVSIGCAQWHDGDAESLIHRADEALYVAKGNGRDQFAVAATPSLGAW